MVILFWGGTWYMKKMKKWQSRIVKTIGCLVEMLK